MLKEKLGFSFLIIGVPFNYEKVLFRVKSPFGVPPTYQIGSNNIRVSNSYKVQKEKNPMKKELAAANAGNTTESTESKDILSSDSKLMSSEKEISGVQTIFGYEPKEIPTLEDMRSSEENLTNSGYANILFRSPEEVAEMEKQENEIIGKIQNVLNDISANEEKTHQLFNKSEQSKLIKYIALAKILLDAKFVFGNRFNAVVNADIISPKQVLRYLRFIMTLESQEKFDTSVKAKKEDIELIVVDLRITSLTEKKIERFSKPSMTKLIKMKSLSNEDFDAVINGDNKPFDKLDESIKIKKAALAEEKKYKQKPDGMDMATFDELLEMGVYEITKKYQASINKETELIRQIQELEKQNEMLEKEKGELEASHNTTKSILMEFIPTKAPKEMA